MIDLHSHTTASDGTFSPAQLVEEAQRIGLRTLGITDHDTFSGYDEALPLARAAGLDLVRGIELSTKLNGHSVHLLGYFLNEQRPGLVEFKKWIGDLQESRRERNIRLVARLQELGLDVTMEEASARGLDPDSPPYLSKVTRTV